MSTSLVAIFSTSVVKKVAMGITGLLLCGFLVSHLLGNFLIFVGPDAFNLYAHTLTSNPLIYGAEAILMAIFLVHLFMATKLVIENKLARPTPYYVKKPTGRGSTFASSTMPFTGLIILIFLVLHLIEFKYGTYFGTTVDGVTMRNLYKTVIDFFTSPVNVVLYIVAMAALSLHVSHGFWSAFQSIGFNHPKYTPCINTLSKVFAVVVFLGYSSLPIFCFLQGGQS
jgi:succinate dehydrogenase / fumarate reductase cytochrome b subunit